MEVLNKLNRFIKHEIKTRRSKLHIEFVVTDYCNLNCKGCTHYAPLAEKEFVSLQQLQASMQHIASVAGKEISQVYLMGGETLLYPQLTEAMTLMRKSFPDQQRKLFTNGILLSKMNEEFWESVRNNGFTIVITRYPVKIDYDALFKLCQTKGVTTDQFADRTNDDTFLRFALDPDGKQNRLMSFLRCYQRGCLTVIGDRLFPCPSCGCVNHLNNAKATDFSIAEGDYLNVFDIHNAGQIYRLRNRPIPFCRYCVTPPQPVEYSLSKRDVREWVNLPDVPDEAGH